MTILETPAPTVAPEKRRLMGTAYDLAEASDVHEARRLAGLDWEPVHRPLYVDLPNDEGLALVEKERAVVRDDTGEMFGVVGREHKILSNADMFDFADTLLSEADTSWAEAEPFGGALGNGSKPFVAVKFGDDIQIAGQDAVGHYLLLVNGHVGNSAFTGMVTPLRYKCSNVVTTASRLKARHSFTIQHSGDLANKVAEAQKAMNLTTAFMREFAEMADRMAEVEMGLAEFDDFLTELVPLADDAGDRAKATVARQRGEFRLNWKNTTTLDPDLRGTRWGALNAVAEVIDHGNLDIRRSKVAPAERRVQSVHFGTGARLRERAYGLLAV